MIKSKITFDINNNVVITDVTTNDEILNIENPIVTIHSVVDSFNYKKRKRL
jgi:hypothetical protein